eukprot:scaffold126018_cov18-Tisochrysis_lutea.AAC.1
MRGAILWWLGTQGVATSALWLLLLALGACVMQAQTDAWTLLAPSALGDGAAGAEPSQSPPHNRQAPLHPALGLQQGVSGDGDWGRVGLGWVSEGIRRLGSMGVGREVRGRHGVGLREEGGGEQADLEAPLLAAPDAS